HARIGQQRQVRTAVHIVRAVDGPVVRGGPVAIDGEGHRRRGALWQGHTDIKLIVRPTVRNARLQRQQLLVVAVVQHQLVNLRPRNQAHALAVFQVHVGLVGSNGQRLGRRADDELLVYRSEE